MIELESCPFCGKEAYVSHTGCTIDGDSATFHFSIKCRRCGATSPNACGTISVNLDSNGELNIWHSDLQKAADNWNTRAKETVG